MRFYLLWWGFFWMGNTWQYLKMIPALHSEITLAVRRQQGMLWIEPRLIVYKANTLSVGLLLWPLGFYLYFKELKFTFIFPCKGFLNNAMI